ncbi:MAG: pantoate--beta-alanine ligase [Nitrospirae bacterium]|nr:pantoate--beta-alanine ligase [Nitrospirota bacterium]
MKVLRSPRTLISWRRRLDRDGITVGMVPTMGALHAGHRALIRKARLACDALVVSLFVNPKQFGPREDFARYPRSFTHDATMCRQEGVDLLYAPSLEAMYPAGHQTSVTVREVSARWEGAVRPHHFGGVVTVVAKLLSAARPDIAFFGQKDFQQTVVIKRLVTDLNLDVTVRVCPTVREADGLALSSRNIYLSPGERRVAPRLYAALQAGRAAMHRGMTSGAEVTRAMKTILAREPLVTVDYLAVCDPMTLEPLRVVRRSAVLLGAIRLGNVRLIDNILVGR